MPNYGNKTYWDKRYKKETVYEWLESYSDLREIINKHCQKDGYVLNLGCGNSIIQEDMYDDGYKNIYNIDISEKCINQMEARKGNRQELVYQTMDCTDLKYQDEMFDFVIDKSTIDALLCGDYCFLNVAKMFSEVQRVLKPNGVYLIVSYGEPYYRTFHFERNHIDFEYTSITLLPRDATDGSGEKQNPHYAYILKKGPNAKQKHTDFYKQVMDELLKEEEEALLKFGSLAENPKDEEHEEHEEDDENREQENKQQSDEKKQDKQENEDFTKFLFDD